jgi:hypothetical protein
VNGLSLSLMASAYVRLEQKDAALFHLLATFSAMVQPRHWDGASLSSLAYCLQKEDALPASLAVHLASTCLSVNPRKFAAADMARILGTLGVGAGEAQYTGLLHQRDDVLRGLYAYFARVLQEIKSRDITPQVCWCLGV